MARRKPQIARGARNEEESYPRDTTTTNDDAARRELGFAAGVRARSRTYLKTTVRSWPLPWQRGQWRYFMPPTSAPGVMKVR
jgi:hypothetical protein